MNNLKKLFTLFLIVGILLLAVAPTLAQDTTIVIPEGTPSFEVAVAAIISIVYALISQPFLAPMASFLVALSKRSKFLKRFKSETLNFSWSAILFLLWMYAVRVGFESEFKTSLMLLVEFGTAALGFFITPVVSSKVYEIAKANDVAILGFSRSTTETVTDTTDKALSNA
jgi:membrane glycosyltransferase